MQTKRDAEENAPQHPCPSAHRKQGKSADGERDPMILAQPDVEAVFREIGSVPRQHYCLRVQRFPAQNPAQVRPPTAFSGSMRVAGLVGKLMMHAMRPHPEDRTAFK